MRLVNDKEYVEMMHRKFDNASRPFQSSNRFQTPDRRDFSRSRDRASQKHARDDDVTHFLSRIILSRAQKAADNNDAVVSRQTADIVRNKRRGHRRTCLTRARESREPSAKQMQRDQCQGCASGGSRMLLQVLQQISRAMARDERCANSSSQVRSDIKVIPAILKIVHLIRKDSQTRLIKVL